MTGRTGAVLYTPELLALAVSLADLPLDPAMPFAGSARSRTCGSSVQLRCVADDHGAIEQVSLQVAACAVGQAAAALFAQGAPGRDRQDIAEACSAIAIWLSEGGETPNWPGIAVLAAVRAHPGRHGAVLLAWEAALDALSKEEARG